MSWQAASFLILALVLLGGFAWYELSRPPSQVVALVAALAALAIAGRLALAALPDVKPFTTDVIVFAGYALGPAAGFAVGALAGLVSNFWLGQGPWTPWQMAAWGLCGVLGSSLALRRRPPGRLILALFCGLAAIGFGALMNFYEMTYGGDLTLKRFLALEARAVPFNAAHAIGNVALALIAGPAMVRMLVRFRRRFEWRAARATAPLALALVLALAALAPARAQASETSRAVGWLVSSQNADGGWGSAPGRASNLETTGWAMLGLEAAGRNPLDVSHGSTPVDFLRAHAGQLGGGGDFARTILALEGAGVDPRSFGGRNLVAALLDRRRSDGSFEGWPASTAFAVMALRQAGATGGLRRSIDWLAGAQNSDGGWGDLRGAPSVPDVTGAVMEAMPGTAAARRGLSYLRSVQARSGGFTMGGGGSVNSQSTAWAAQGMLAVGADPGAPGQGGQSALDYLAARQASDGHFAYSSSSDQSPVWVTADVLPAVAGQAFPVAAPPRQAKPAGGNGSPHATAKKPSLPGPTGVPRSPGSGASAPAPLGSAGVKPPSPSAGLPGSLGGRAGGGALPAPSPRGKLPATPGTGGVPTIPSPPGGGSSGSGVVQGTPAAATFTPQGSSGPAPWAPLGIALLSGALTLGGVVLLGRRFGW